MDTIETAFNRAREAQRRGLNSISVTVPAQHRTMALRVDVAAIMTDGKDSGVDGLVVRRFASTPWTDPATGITLPGKIDTLIVRASVADVLEMGRRSVERELTPLSPVKRATRRRSLAHLLSR